MRYEITNPEGRLYIGNIPYHLKYKHIARMFGKFGELKDVFIPLKESREENRGFAFVEFVHTDDALEAMESLDGAIMGEDMRKITVRVADTRA